MSCISEFFSLTASRFSAGVMSLSHSIARIPRNGAEAAGIASAGCTAAAGAPPSNRPCAVIRSAVLEKVRRSFLLLAVAEGSVDHRLHVGLFLLGLFIALGWVSLDLT